MNKTFAEVIRKFLQSLSLFGLATVLATVVWITAANEENPIVEQVYPQPIMIEMKLLTKDMVISRTNINDVAVLIRAPSQTWSALRQNQINISADLNGLPPGSHVVPLKAIVNIPNVEILSVSPSEISISLERIVTRTVPITVNVQGEPAVGYIANTPLISAENIIVTGSESDISQLDTIKLNISISQEKSNINRTFTFSQIGVLETIIDNLILQPKSTTVTIPIRQMGGYRDVAVRALLEGKPEPGYRITNITTSPPTITVFSSDPDQLTALPGFVETEPLDISSASQDVDARLTMALPEGVTAVSEQSIVVLVSIEAVETSQRIRQNVTVTGLGPNLSAQISPDSVDVIMSGPLPVLDSLTRENVKVMLDLLHLAPGSYDVEPSIIVSGPDVIKTDTILPAFIRVNISEQASMADEEETADNNAPDDNITIKATNQP